MIARPPSRYPEPDRSDYQPNTNPSAADQPVDRGWASGVMSDGRPFRLDVWSRGETWMFMFHFSAVGIQTTDATLLGAILEREALVRVHDRSIKWLAARSRDARGHLMVGVGTVSHDARTTYVELLIPITQY